MANETKYRIVESGRDNFFIQDCDDCIFWHDRTLYDKDGRPTSRFKSEKEARKALETIKQQRQDAQVKRIVYQE